MNNWNELSVKVSRETEVAVSNMLIEAGAQGVAIEDTQDYLNNVDHFGEILPDVVQLDTIIIKAYYPENISIIELSGADSWLARFWLTTRCFYGHDTKLG